MNDRKTGVVIPAYKPELSQFRPYVQRIQSQLDPATVLVAIDSPNRETVQELQSLPVTIDSVPYRRGKGAAVTAGFERLDTDIMLFADADGATPADSLVEITQQVQRNDVSLAVGSRRHPKSEISDSQTPIRRVLGGGFSQLAAALLSVELHDYQCGAKAIEADAWQKVRDHLYEPGFAWDVELIAITGAFDITVAEVPIEWHDRPNSTVAPVRDTARMFQALLTAHHRARRIDNDRIHTAIASRTSKPTPLIEQRREA